MEHNKTIRNLFSIPGKFVSQLWKGVIILAVGILAAGWLFLTPPGLLGKSDSIGYAVCHRIDVRSFHLGERQLPLCARCSGMYLGAMLGLVYQMVSSRKRAGMPPIRVWVLFGFFVAAFGIDGLNSYLHLFPGAPSLYEPNNTFRLLTGTGMGLAIAGAIYPAFNQTAWENWDRSPAIPDLKYLLPLIALALVVDWMVVSQNPLLIYPLALVSSAGVLVLLTIVYSMMWLMILRLENRFQEFSELWLPLLGGFGMALLQIVVLDLARFALTGTWEGFHIG
jgi:uncharacterized membrane protein